MFEGCGLYYNVGKGVDKEQRVGKEYNLQMNPNKGLHGGAGNWQSLYI